MTKAYEQTVPGAGGQFWWCQATDPATDANNYIVGSGLAKLWIETEDDTDPGSIVAVHVWDFANDAWLTWPIGAASSGGDADTLDGLDSTYFLLLSNIAGPTVSKTANYTATTADYAILCDATGGVFSITLPAAASNTGRVYLIKKTDASANAVTVDGNASETIDGATTQSLGNENEAVLIVCNGTGWFIMSRPGASSSGIQNSIMDAKGDLIVASTADTPATLTVGSNGDVLTADSGEATGVKWAPPAAATIADGSVTLAKMANLAQDQFIGRTTASTGVPETATITAAARTVLDDTTVGAMLTTMGGAPLASPTFTGTVTLPADQALTGNPTVPTQAAGNSSTRAASTAFVAAAVTKAPQVFIISLSDETTAITTGTDKAKMRAPFAGTLTAIRSGLSTTSSSGNPTVDMNKNGTTMLSTKLSIDSGEVTSTTAATPAVISVSTFSDDDEFEFDIDTAGTGAKGLKVTIYLTPS